MARPPTSGARRGFTVLEMLVVLAILALAVGLLGPRMLGGRKGMELAEGERLVAFLRRARLDAMRTGVPVRLRVDADAGIVSRDVDGVRLALDSPVSVVGERSRSIESSADLIFHPNGGSSGGLLAVAGERRRILVAIDWLTGHASLAEAAP